MTITPNLVGREFGDLLVKARFGKGRHGSTWLCVCKCGRESVVICANLTRGNTRSCGKHKMAWNKRHGESHTHLHNLWEAMRQRCKNPRLSCSKYYALRGISVCPEWGTYEVFRDWAISNGYKSGLQIDRIDNNGNYEPTNCHFVTRIQQMNNKSNNHLLTVLGETKTIAEWSRDSRCATTMKNMRNRVKNGWSDFDVVTYLPRNASNRDEQYDRDLQRRK